MTAVIILLNSSGLYAQQSKWEKLGSRKVNFTLDKDVIQLGAKEGAFSKLMIKVTGGAINMHRMIIQYGNGGKEEVDALREVIESGWWGKGPKVAEFEEKFGI